MADGDTRDDSKLPPLEALPGPRVYPVVADEVAPAAERAHGLGERVVLVAAVDHGEVGAEGAAEAARGVEGHVAGAEEVVVPAEDARHAAGRQRGGRGDGGGAGSEPWDIAASIAGDARGAGARAADL